MGNSHSQRHSTFHEQWYKVEELTPALRQEVNIRRQLYWGKIWYILSEPDNNVHFRLAKAAYMFVSMLDGERSVQEIWETCQEAEDEGLTQGEAIALLGQLHTSNLLLLDAPSDVDRLLQRQQKKRLKKLGGTLSSFLFLRFPLLTPDAFFTRFQKIGSLPFRPLGFGIWLLLALLAIRGIVVHWDMFMSDARQMLHPSNLIWIYVVTVFAKIVHECGHAFACKYFSAKNGFDGDVHSMGIMLLLFIPVPYIDVSSSVQILSRKGRAFVGLGGIYCELFLAFIATMLWVNSAEGTSIHLLAHNCMIITSVTTVLFNINPLLRFDGYFVFSDLIGMPNLYQRSQSYAVYLVKRYVLGVVKASNVVEEKSEKIFYPIYAVAAFLYRLFITIGIFIVLEDNFATLGSVLAVGLCFIWFALPLIKGLIYLVKGEELAGMRLRAWQRFGIVFSILAVLLLGIPVENFIVVEGVVESRSQHLIFAEVEGSLSTFAPTDVVVTGRKSVVATIENSGLKAKLREMQLTSSVNMAKYEHARDRGDTDTAAMFLLEYQAIIQQLALLKQQINKLKVIAPADGVWVAPDLTRRQGKWLGQGDMLGVIYDPENLRLRAVVDQFDAARLFSETITRSEFCISGRMDRGDEQRALYSASLEDLPSPAGRRELFHPSLSITAGGDTPVVQDKDGRTVTANYFFELRLLPSKESVHNLLPGQKVSVRLVFGEQPVGIQWLRRIQQFIRSN